MTSTLTRFEALKLSVLRAGTQEELAAVLNVTQPAISNWLRHSKQLPAEHVLKVEATYGVSRHDLRPDIYPRSVMTDQGGEGRFYGTDNHARSFAA